MNLKVYQVAPAPTGTAQWLGRLLRPVIVAVKFEHGAPPLELRQTGRLWRGWSMPRDMAPDGRVALSKLMLFRSTRELVDVYLHEVAHSLLHNVPGAVPGHDAAFFALSVALRQRIGHLDGDPVSLVAMMSLYDLADLPSELLQESDAGVGRCITWSIEIATELASAALSAEGLASEIVKRYQAWLDALRDQPRLDRVARRKAQGQAAAVDRLKDKLFLSNFAAGISSVLLVLVAVMLWHR